MNVVVIIQARMTSSRMPGKVLAPLNGKPVLAHVVERALRIGGINSVVVTRPWGPESRAIDYWCDELGVCSVAEEENDVLNRYYRAAVDMHAGTVIRITGDCPAFCPGVVTRLLQEYKATGADYAFVDSSCGYPKGFDSEVFNMDNLVIAHSEASSLSDREHVTPFIRRHARKQARLRYSPDLGKYDLSLDTTVDYSLLKKLFFDLGDNFDIADVQEWICGTNG